MSLQNNDRAAPQENARPPSETGKSVVKVQIIRLARRLIRIALAITSPTIFIRLLNEQLVSPELRPRLIDGGLKELGQTLSGIAQKERLPFANGLALSITTQEDFLPFLQEQLRSPIFRPQLVDGGLEKMRLTLADIAAEEDIAFTHRQECYSQEGEDLFLTRLFSDQPSGFYVDAGALHPVRFSNTYLLYKKGWRGINIDATPGAMKAFNWQRPGDINVECMISPDASPRTYYEFSEPALNTMSKEMAFQRVTEGFPITSQTQLHPKTLAAVLDENMPPDTAIDVMNVDLEGMDLAVLKSNDWTRYRPRVLVVELLGAQLDAIAGSDIHQFLTALNYRLTAKFFNSAVFLAS